jgi:hypothetical protein
MFGERRAPVIWPKDSSMSYIRESPRGDGWQRAAFVELERTHCRMEVETSEFKTHRRQFVIASGDALDDDAFVDERAQSLLACGAVIPNALTRA